MSQNAMGSLRLEYLFGQLEESEMAHHPLEQFQIWFDEAVSAQVHSPNAMALATANQQCEPNARMVLLQEFGPSGFCFYTNLESPKAKELTRNPQASLLFFWAPLERQIRICGTVEPVPVSKADSYFGSRPRDSQIAAWTSKQSAPIHNRSALDQQFQQQAHRFERHHPIPRPPFWGGFCLTPTRFEFWQGGKNRLHDRILYLQAGSTWEITRLSP